LNEAFGLELPYSPSYCGLRLILQGVDPTALEAAFRRHAVSLSKPPPSRADRDRRRRQNIARQFRRVQRPQGAHMMSALRHADRIVLAHVMVAEKSNEIPAARN